MQQAKDTVHISSIVVHCVPQQFNKVLEKVSTLESCEIGAHNGRDKLIPIFETETEHRILDAITEIQLMEGVISATMVYHEIDDEIEEPESI